MYYSNFQYYLNRDVPDYGITGMIMLQGHPLWVPDLPWIFQQIIGLARDLPLLHGAFAAICVIVQITVQTVFLFYICLFPLFPFTSHRFHLY